MPSDSNTPRPSDWKQARESAVATLQWIGLSLIGLTALTLAAAHAPARIRLLGLFAAAFGGLCGWGMARGQVALRAPVRSWWGAFVTGVLISAAGIALTLESWRLWRREYLQTSLRNVPAPLRENASQTLRPLVDRETPLDVYLERRVKNLGEWQSPWPEVFWLAEVVLGTAAGVVAFWWTNPTRQPGHPR